MWDEAKHKPYTCACGRRVRPAGQGKHEAGVWHRQHGQITSMLERGVSYAEIGRQLGVTRVHVRLMVKAAA